MRTEHASLHDVKQRSKRTKSVAPVSLRIAGSEASHLAHTLDVSNHGVKLRGCRGEMKVGDKTEIRCRQKRAQFRVAWITIPKGSSEKQIEAECLELRTGKAALGCAFPSTRISPCKRNDRDQPECPITIYCIRSMPIRSRTHIHDRSES